MIRLTCIANDQVLDGSSLLPEHGLSLFIQTPSGTVLYDTGGSARVLLHNAAQLDIDLATVDALALSHAHLDHTGGLAAVLEINPSLPIYAHPDLLRPRYRSRDGKTRQIGLDAPGLAALAQADTHFNAAPCQIIPEIWSLGEIVERNNPQGRSEWHFIKQADGLIPDPYRDDLSLVIKTTDGLILVCGCCHAGLLNTLERVRTAFEGPVMAIVGGTHLVNTNRPELVRVADVLADEYGHPHLWLNHCTGARTLEIFSAQPGDRVQPLLAGMSVEFYT